MSSVDKDDSSARKPDRDPDCDPGRDPDCDGVVETAALPSQAAAIQVLLAEKRTSLAVMRTAIAIAAIPLSVTTVLVTLSRYYSWLDNLHFLVPMYVVLTAMTAISIYLMIRSLFKIHHYDKTISRVKRCNPVLREIVD